jgi:hypothetical protein
MKIANPKTITKGVRDPMSDAIPKRISRNPRYMGCLLKRNTPSVTKAVDSSRGLTVVSFFLKDLSATRFITIPSTKGIMPRRFQGKGRTRVPGNRKCSSKIIAIERNK